MIFAAASSVLLCVGLGAACGLRAFTSALVVGIAASTGALVPTDGFEWIGSSQALVVLALCSVIELLAYVVPAAARSVGLIATPLAMVTGTVLSAAALGDVHALIAVTVPLMAGGSAAGLSQSLAVFHRPASGSRRRLASAAAEGAASVALAALSVASPPAAGLVALAVFVSLRKSLRESVTR